VIIDTHAHVTGPAELYAFSRELQAAQGPFRPSRPDLPDELIARSLTGHIDEVDSVGTELQLVSPRPWAVPTGDRREAVVEAVTRAANDMIHRATQLFPNRFRGLAALPQTAATGVTRSVDELDRCVRELGFVGCKINPDPGEGAVETPHMGDEYWYPLYEKMVELDAPGLIHGGPFRFSREPELGYFISEQSVAAYGILRSRVFKDFPNLKLIVGHGGGSIPYQVGRGRAFRLNQMMRGGDDLESFDASMRRLYYDTVLYNQESLELLFKVVGVDRCLFGSDKPANGSVKDPETGRSLNDIKPMIDDIAWLSAAERRAIYEDNARAVFARLKL
jgi:predicted TIM-barrel fold metal-dependent hydrolase